MDRSTLIRNAAADVTREWLESGRPIGLVSDDMAAADIDEAADQAYWAEVMRRVEGMEADIAADPTLDPDA